MKNRLQAARGECRKAVPSRNRRIHHMHLNHSVQSLPSSRFMSACFYILARVGLSSLDQ